MRRILDFARGYPSARRVMLATNYRCPAEVVTRSARLIARNRERFAKPIRSPPGAAADERAIVAWNSGDPSWPEHVVRLAAAEDRAGRSCCFLARTRAELMPVLVALVRAGIRHAAVAPPLVETVPVTALVDAARAHAPADRRHPFHVLQQLRFAQGWSRGQASGDLLSDEDHAALDALLGWTVGFRAIDEFLAAFDEARARIAALRDPEAPVELATIHGSKGREWETVVLLGFEAERMPNRRSLADADDPDRAMEEERRLAYVALTRATRRLILAFDPRRASPFLAEMGFGTRKPSRAGDQSAIRPSAHHSR